VAARAAGDLRRGRLSTVLTRYADLLGADGPVAGYLPDFAPRPQQQEMAGAVGEALDNEGLLIAEAGAGTGKTLAYLVPAVASGGRVIIATGTKTLQEQLYFRDGPLVRDALGGGRLALLKGRANYLCLHRLSGALDEGPGDGRAAQLEVLRDWAARTRSGDIAEVSEIPGGDPIWPEVTSTADNCLGSECPAFHDCFVYRARHNALQADVVVVNHHLLFADMTLRREGHGELLPEPDAVILDEAHQVPEIAARFFGLAVSSRQLIELGRDSRAELTREVGDMPAVTEAAAALEARTREARLAFGSERQRAPWAHWQQRHDPEPALEALEEALSTLAEALERAAEASAGLANCQRRSLVLGERLETLRQAPPEGQVQWAETTRSGFTLHRTPLDVAPDMRELIDSRRSAWVFTSATLAVEGSFEHFAERLGVPDADTLLLDSPFDFSARTLMYRPPGMPEPGSPDYDDAVLEAALPVIRASEGRAFFLFTSHRALERAARRLRDALPYTLLAQGEAPRAELIRRFRDSGNAVLLGTASFWEGVDVRGPALELVIIDRLPFAAPGDPVLQARLDALRQSGANPFRDYQLPQAVIALKQGVGRLIRDAGDRGVVMVCDPRLDSRSYGTVFLDSLPDMPVTRDIAAVESFFARLRDEGRTTEYTK